MSLYKDASLVMIPSAVKDGKLYSIRPVEELGDELVTNGNFATDSDWTKASNWTISSGKAIADGSGIGALSQSIATSVVGKKYKISFTISNYNSGNIRMYYGGQFTSFVTSNGVHSATITATSADTTIMTSISSAFNGYIDNVSVKEAITANGDFTFSRGSNLAATRVDVNGLIEKGRENLLLQSNQFDTTWSQSGVTLTGGQTGYDGSSDAWEMEKGASSYRRVSQSVSLSGVQTLSVYAKANTQDVVSLWCDGTSTDPAVAFNLTTLSWVYGSSNYIERGYESVGNGWYRVWMSYTNTISQVRIYVGWNDSDAGSIYIQDAQLEQGLVATDYIETGASTAQSGILEDLPRLDYSGGASCPSLLLEPQRTNVVTNSEYVSSNDYVVGNWTGTITTNTTETTSPEGVYNATKYVKSGASDRVYFHSSQPDGAYTGSVWLKAASGSENTTIEISVRRFGGGGGSTSKLVTITNEWQRFDVTATNLTGGTTTAMYVADFSMGGTATEFYSYGMQIEAGSYATSYIPTMGSAVTRSADYVQQNTLRPNNLSGSAFTYFLDMNVNTSVAAFSGYFNEVDSGGAYKAGFVWSNGLQWRTPVGGGNYYVTLDSVLAKGDRAKMLVAVDGTERRVYYNGTLIITIPNCDNDGADTDGIVPYYGSANVNFYSGLYNQIVVFDTALTDSECIALTTL